MIYTDIKVIMLAYCERRAKCVTSFCKKKECSNSNVFFLYNRLKVDNRNNGYLKNWAHVNRK